MLTVTLSCAGFGYTLNASAVLSPSSLQVEVRFSVRVPLFPQVLLAVTFTLPAPVPHVTSMLLLPCPEEIVPLDTNQLFAGCGERDGTLKFRNAPAQNEPAGFCVMLTGVDGVPAMAIVLGDPLPGAHRLVLAVTDNDPVV